MRRAEEGYMDDSKRVAIIEAGWEIHRVVEDSLVGGSAAGVDLVERRRLLLADMAIHLLQTALKPGDIELDKLRNNLHAILTIADPFLPDAGLKGATGKIYLDGSDCARACREPERKP
jgi:hypothetical protein